MIFQWAVMLFVERWKTRWWFDIFFIFNPVWGRFPIWRAYFSSGWFNHHEENHHWNFWSEKFQRFYSWVTCDHSGLGLQVVAIFYLWEKTQHFPKVMNFSYLIPDFYYYYCDFQHLGHLVAPGFLFSSLWRPTSSVPSWTVRWETRWPMPSQPSRHKAMPSDDGCWRYFRKPGRSWKNPASIIFRDDAGSLGI